VVPTASLTTAFGVAVATNLHGALSVHPNSENGTHFSIVDGKPKVDEQNRDTFSPERLCHAAPAH
jgi:hypothetical protein